MQRKDGRKLSKDAQQELRVRVIEYWERSGNMRLAAETFNVPYVTVRKWVGKVKESGKEVLNEDNRGRPSWRELSDKQEKRMIRLITEKNPEQLKLRFGLWTREMVGELMTREFGIIRSVWQIGRYLKEWGFTPQKPVYKAYEQNSEWVKNWLTKVYPGIRAEAKRRKAMIFWGDETGVRSTDQRGRGYSLKGETPVVHKTGRQFGLTMISAVNNRGKLYFMFCKKGINSQTFIRFMNRLIKSQKGKIFLIVDNLPAHKTKMVQSWLEENQGRISIFYLPSYSPELNPDEYLNQDLKANITGKVSLESVEDLKKGVAKFMNRRKRNPGQVKKYFHHPKVRYAA
jgi:transposase